MNEQRDPYVPIECGLHSQYELAIMHGNNIQLSWMDQQQNRHSEEVTPLDLITRDRKEYLVIRTSNGEQYQVRLDKIIHTP